jgi:hypothetical protein
MGTEVHPSQEGPIAGLLEVDTRERCSPVYPRGIVADRQRA